MFSVSLEILIILSSLQSIKNSLISCYSFNVFFPSLFFVGIVLMPFFFNRKHLIDYINFYFLKYSFWAPRVTLK